MVVRVLTCRPTADIAVETFRT